MDRVLPYRYRFAHSFCTYLVYELIDILDNGRALGFYDISLESEKYLDIPADLHGDSLWQWLLENDCYEVVEKMYFSSLFPSLLMDLCNFIFEALSCSERGKITIAYTLLRKPLSENLFYLEWLLANPKKFICNFHNKPATAFSNSLVGERKRATSIIEAALSKLIDKSFYQENIDLLYDLRFSKDFEPGFYRYWNQSTHIVTTNEKLVTKDRNLNFIFDEDNVSNLHYFWEHIYTYMRLPFLLMYAVDISDTLMSIAGDFKVPQLSAAYLRRNIGFLLLNSEMDRLKTFTESKDAGKLSNVSLPCPHCKTQFPASHGIYLEFFELGRSLCRNCQQEVDLVDIANFMA